VVIAQGLGVLLNEWDDTGGFDKAAVEAAHDSESRPLAPMIGKVTGVSLSRGLTVETTLDPRVQPFLYDHQIDGTPVLPGVMGVEAFAEAAGLLLPDWHVEAVEDVTFIAPFKFYRSEPRTLTIEAVLRPDANGIIADCKLIGHRTLPNQAEPQATVHFAGRVRMTKEALPPASTQVPAGSVASAIEASDVYRVYFHGPAYQVVERAWWDEERIVGEMNHNLPPDHVPAKQPLVVEPRLIELCLQTAGLQELSVQNRMGLPHQIGRVTVFRPADGAGSALFAVVTPHPDQNCFDAQVVDASGKLYVQLAGYRTAALPVLPDTELLKALHALTA
jgi:hypothetical protein